MDLYSLVTNTKTAELIFNLSIQVIAVSLIGWVLINIIFTLNKAKELH